MKDCFLKEPCQIGQGLGCVVYTSFIGLSTQLLHHFHQRREKPAFVGFD